MKSFYKEQKYLDICPSYDLFHLKLRQKTVRYIYYNLMRKDNDQAKMSEFPTKKAYYLNSDLHQVQITDALLKFIAGNLLPLSIVKSKEFKNLMEIADSKYQIPSEEHLSTKLLFKKSTEARNNMKHQLKRTGVDLTIDKCPSSQIRGVPVYECQHILF